MSDVLVLEKRSVSSRKNGVCVVVILDFWLRWGSLQELCHFSSGLLGPGLRSTSIGLSECFRIACLQVAIRLSLEAVRLGKAWEAALGQATESSVPPGLFHESVAGNRRTRDRGKGMTAEKGWWKSAGFLSLFHAGNLCL